MGLITGRKAFSRPLEDGVALLHAVQDVYLDDRITLACKAGTFGAGGEPKASPPPGWAAL